MRNIYLITLILILFFCTGFSDPVADISVSYQSGVDKLEEVFKASLLLNKNDIMFTKVPRGLIVSINEKYFFNTNQTRIKESALPVIDTIIDLLQGLSNYCVIEDHTEEMSFNNKNWELSLVRSANIAEYMITKGKISAERIFFLGYGQYMPFRDNVAPRKGMNNRIDFVILEYESKR